MSGPAGGRGAGPGEVPGGPEIARLQEQVRVLSTLLEVGRDITSTLNLREVLDRAFASVERVLRAERSSVWRLDPASGTLSFLMMRGTQEDNEMLRGLRMKLGEGVVGWVAEKGEPLIIPDVEKDRRWSRRVDKMTEFRTRSILCVPLVANGRTIGVIQLLNRTGGGPFTPEDRDRLMAVAAHVAVALDNALLYEEKRRTFLGLAAILAEVIERRDAYTGGHIRRVVSYSLSIGRRLEVSSADMEHLKLSAILHDVGKIGIEDRILNKPGRLSDEEEARMRDHVTIGAQILSGGALLQPVIPGVRHHHERWDGKGYPDALAGESIPLQGRIITVADTFDAMTTTRPYRKNLSHEVAFAELQRCARVQFDPACVRAFLEARDAGEVEFRPDESILL